MIILQIHVVVCMRGEERLSYLEGDVSTVSYVFHFMQ